MYTQQKLLKEKINKLKTFFDKLNTNQINKLVNGRIDNEPHNSYFSIVIQVIFNEMIDKQRVENVHAIFLLLNEIETDIINVIKYWYSKAKVDNICHYHEYISCVNYLIGCCNIAQKSGNKSFKYEGVRMLGTLIYLLNDKPTKCLIEDDEDY